VTSCRGVDGIRLARHRKFCEYAEEILISISVPESLLTFMVKQCYWSDYKRARSQTILWGKCDCWIDGRLYCSSSWRKTCYLTPCSEYLLE